MKATLTLLAALLLTAVTTSHARAEWTFFRNLFSKKDNCSNAYSLQAPNAFSPGYHGPNWCGGYCPPMIGSWPSGPPFAGGQPSVGAPVHPFARSPRDFFMMEH